MLYINQLKIKMMACLSVHSVNEKIAFIQDLEEVALEREAGLIAKDLKAYIENNFMLTIKFTF